MRSGTHNAQNGTPYTIIDIPRTSFATRDRLLALLNHNTSPIEDIVQGFVNLRQQYPFDRNQKNLYILHKILEMAFISKDQWKFLSLFICLVTEHKKYFEDEFHFAHSPHHLGSGTPLEMLQFLFHDAYVQLSEILSKQNVSCENPYSEMLRLKAQLAESQAQLSAAQTELNQEKIEHGITAHRLFRAQRHIGTLENEIADIQGTRRTSDASTSTDGYYSIWRARANSNDMSEQVSQNADRKFTP